MTAYRPPAPAASTRVFSQSPSPCDCGSKSVPCGCADCEPPKDDCCGLTCLVQPRFFCGQLLTDADLTELLRWTKRRLGLARYRDGWGVVRGLDVSIADGDIPGVVISPGYAVTCCGDDVILCEPFPFPVGDACGPRRDPCEDQLQNARRARSSAALTAAIDRTQEAQASGCAEAEPVNCDESEPRDGCTLTLSIRYREVPSSPQTILRGGACHQTGHCEPSRTQESFAFEWLNDPVDPDRRRVEDFCTSYEGCADVIDRFASIAHSDDGLAKFKQWYRSRIASLPVRHFPILDDFISNLDEDRAQVFARELPNNPEAMLILVLIVQECRFNLLRKLEETCYACDPNRGVPLARVRLSPGASGRMKVAMVEPFPPFRRSLRLDDCWPVCPGAWNLGRFIWQPVPDVCIALRELGFHVTSQVLGAGNMHLLAHPPMVGCGTGKNDCCPPENPHLEPESLSLCVTWIDARDGSHRVVAIAPGPCLQQQPAKKNPAPRSKPADRQATPRSDQGPIR